MAQAHGDTGNIILQAMVSMAAADGDVQASEVAAIRGLYAQFTGGQIGTDEISAARFGYRVRGLTFAGLLARERRHLTREMREKILKSAYLVLLADGRVGARERKKLADFAEALNISEIHRGVIFEDAERTLH